MVPRGPSPGREVTDNDRERETPPRLGGYEAGLGDGGVKPSVSGTGWVLPDTRKGNRAAENGGVI